MTTTDDRVQARLTEDAKAIIARYPRPRSALLPLLHLVQSEEGYVSERGMGFCAGLLGLTVAEVQSVATFYSMYRRKPAGDYHIGVCTNTLCAVMGGDEVFDALREHLGTDDDEATDDGLITLEQVACNAACDYAPVVMVNWEFFDNMTPESARSLAGELQAGRAVWPTRGTGPLCTFRQTARELAGFRDERDGADADGGTGGEPTLAGLRVARDRGWRAPDPAAVADPEAGA